MDPLLKERAELLAAAHAIVAAIKADGNRAPTEDETAALETKTAAIREIDDRIARAKAGQAALSALGALGMGDASGDDGEAEPATLGEHFVKHAQGRFAALREASGAKGGRQETAAAPFFEIGRKANTDTQITTGSGFVPILTEYDRTIIRGVRPPLVIEDLMSHGQISGNAISYFVEAAFEGSFTTVAEAGAKPQVHVVDPTSRTDALKKIAGFLKFSDEMLDDLDFIVSEINNRGLYKLNEAVQTQLISGDGTGTNILGLVNRSGVQTETAATADDDADALFRAITKVQTGSGLIADGLGIHPLDYQALRLSRDANGQYFGGGFFTGPYGNGSVMENPPVWGLRTVVSSAFTQGTAVVGAFNQAATAYDKAGRGVRVESTNSHASDFTSNLITTRIETRKALAVRVPSAFVKVTLV